MALWEEATRGVAKNNCANAILSLSVQLIISIVDCVFMLHLEGNR